MPSCEEDERTYEVRDLTSLLGEAKNLPYWDFPHEHQDFITHQYALSSSSYISSLFDMDTSLHRNVDEVASGVWAGDKKTALDHNGYRLNNIGGVLNMAKEIDYIAPPGVFPVKIGINDGEIAPEGTFIKAAQEIDSLRRQGRRVLVHCAAGVSRSVAAIIAYLMLIQGMTFRGALEHIRERRPQANPHHLLVRSLVRDLGNRFIK